MCFQSFSEHKSQVPCALYPSLTFPLHHYLRWCKDNLINSYKMWYENCLMWILMKNPHETSYKGAYKKASLPSLLGICVGGWWSGVEKPWFNALNINNTQITDVGGERISLSLTLQCPSELPSCDVLWRRRMRPHRFCTRWTWPQVLQKLS